MAFYFQLDDGLYEVITADTIDEAATRYAGWPITFEDLLTKIEADGGRGIGLFLGDRSSDGMTPTLADNCEHFDKGGGMVGLDRIGDNSGSEVTPWHLLTARES